MESPITSATDTNQKNRNIIKEVGIAIEKSKAVVSAIALKGLHFDVLLGINWLKAAGAMIDLVNVTIK